MREITRLLRAERLRLIVEAYERHGKNATRVGDEFGVSRERIRQLLAEAGIPSIHVDRRTIPQETIDAIEAMVLTGARITEIAGRFGVSYATARHYAYEAKERNLAPGETLLDRRRIVSREATVKICCRCKLELPVGMFGTNADRADGREPRCRQCGCELQREVQARRRKNGLCTSCGRQRDREGSLCLSCCSKLKRRPKKVISLRRA